jgi:hypothetical protein
MKSLSILFLSFLMVNPLGAVPKLSSSSKKSIIASIIGGAITGLGITAFSAAVAKDLKLLNPKDASSWAITGGAAALLGGILGGIGQYNHTPEKCIENVKQQLSLVSQDMLLGMLYQTKSEDWIATVKGYFARSRFPLMSAFSYLSALYDTIETANCSLRYIYYSDNEAVRQEAQELENYINTTRTLLQGVLSKITGEPNYTSECSAKAQEDAANALIQATLSPQARPATR